jgi:Kdo2-lipid IVA lauroyltransferase/acyltransferase
VSRLLLGLLWLAHFLPLRLIAAIGDALGVALFWLIPERRRVTRINLERCFPLMPPAERERLARAHFRSFCRSFVERAVLWWGSRERILRMVRIEGLEHLRALGGAPAILFVPHFAGIDAGLMRLVLEVSVVGIYANPKEAQLGAWLRRGRGRFGNLQQISRQEGVRAALPWIRKGWPFYYLPDQDYGPRGALFVPFFGVPAATMPGLSRIARITGAKVLPCVSRMLPGSEGYVVTIEPPWDNFPSADLAADTRRMNEYIERRVMDMPEQYLWMHKRFKTRPPGEPSFYLDA